MRIGPSAGNRLWFEYENYRRHPRFLALSEEEKAIVEQFDRDGCYLCRNAVGEATVEAVNDVLDAWMMQNAAALAANRRPDGTHPRLIGLHQEVPAIRQLFYNETALKLRELLFGCGPSRDTSITFLQGSQQPLHRDIPVFHLAPGNRYFRMWFALEDTTPKNGTLTGVKGGHKVAAEQYRTAYRFYRRFDEIPAQEPDAWRRYQETLESRYEAAGLAEEPFALSAGDVLIWHPLFPHGGSVIEDKTSSRRSVVLHVSHFPPI